jgi:hypothetical protein
MQRVFINAIQLQQESEKNFLYKTDRCHRKARRDFKSKINTTLKKLQHYGLPSLTFMNCIRRNAATQKIDFLLVGTGAATTQAMQCLRQVHVFAIFSDTLN